MTTRALPLAETEHRFWQALLVALSLHVVVWILWHLFPHIDTVIVPVRALNLRIGENETIAVQEVDIPAPTLSEALVPSGPLSDVARALSPPVWHAAKPPKQKRDSVSRRHVRRQAISKGSVYGNSAASEAEELARYEQLISSWVQRYRIYPAGPKAQGTQGEGVVRIRINRAGTIVYYAIDRSTGNDQLDKAMLVMVRQASPVPPVPARYSSGTLVEFLIPVRFALESR